MTYKIEKGIPIPPKGVSSGRKPKYPVRDLEVGDSFFVPALDVAPEMARAAINKSAKRCGIKVTTRVSDDGVRVWRVE